MTSEIEYDSVEKLGGKRKETIHTTIPSWGKKKNYPFQMSFSCLMCQQCIMLERAAVRMRLYWEESGKD